MEITREIAEKVLGVVDCGLSCGKGIPEPGKMCVEAAVTFALGEEFSDKPSCVAPSVRSLKININDSIEGSNEERARIMRRLAIAQLGTRDTLNELKFAEMLVDLVIRKTIPQCFETVVENPKLVAHKENLLAAAERCRKEGTKESAENARAAANAAANAAAYAADAADAAAANAAYAAFAAAKTVAYDHVDNKVLEVFAEDVVQILIKLETPGSKFLFLTEEKQ